MHRDRLSVTPWRTEQDRLVVEMGPLKVDQAGAQHKTEVFGKDPDDTSLSAGNAKRDMLAAEPKLLTDNPKMIPLLRDP